MSVLCGGAPKNIQRDYYDRLLKSEPSALLQDHKLPEEEADRIRKLHAETDRLCLGESLLTQYASDYNDVVLQYEHQSLCAMCLRRLDDESLVQGYNVRGVVSLGCCHMFHMACVRGAEEKNQIENTMQRALTCSYRTCGKPWRVFFPVDWTWFDSVWGSMSDDDVIAELRTICPSSSSDKRHVILAFSRANRHELINHVLQTYDCSNIKIPVESEYDATTCALLGATL